MKCAWVFEAALALAACGALAAPVTVRDDAGHTLTLAEPARRIVTLSPHLTELAFAAGAGDKVVGVMRYSDHPEAATRLPVVGDAFALNFEAIARLRPDLVLVWGSGVNDRHKTQLRAMKLPVYESEVGSVEGIADTLRRIGELAGTAATAHAQADRMQAQWTALRQRHAGRAPVRVFYQLWSQPLLTINRDHVIDEVLRACGGVNVFAGLPTLTPTVSWEAAVKADPQLIVGAGAPGERMKPGRWLQFNQVDAVRHGRFATVDGSLVSRMGPRFLQGAEQLCNALESARR